MYKANPKFPVGSFENRGQGVPLPIKLLVSPYLLSSIVSTALEGGINYWCRKARLFINPVDAAEEQSEADVVVTVQAKDEVYNEFISRNVALGGSLTIYEYDEDDDSETPHKLTRDNLLAGLAKFVEEGHTLRAAPDVDGTLDLDLDAGDADNVIQYALFGKLVYG